MKQDDLGAELFGNSQRVLKRLRGGLREINRHEDPLQMQNLRNEFNSIIGFDKLSLSFHMSDC